LVKNAAGSRISRSGSKWGSDEYPAAETALRSQLRQVEAICNIMLNPLSHSGTTTLERVEVERAIDVLAGLQLPSR
jgi:hypothetical protein